MQKLHSKFKNFQEKDKSNWAAFLKLNNKNDINPLLIIAFSSFALCPHLNVSIQSTKPNESKKNNFISVFSFNTASFASNKMHSAWGSLSHTLLGLIRNNRSKSSSSPSIVIKTTFIHNKKKSVCMLEQIHLGQRKGEREHRQIVEKRPENRMLFGNCLRFHKLLA